MSTVHLKTCVSPFRWGVEWAQSFRVAAPHTAPGYLSGSRLQSQSPLPRLERQTLLGCDAGTRPCVSRGTTWVRGIG